MREKIVLIPLILFVICMGCVSPQIPTSTPSPTPPTIPPTTIITTPPPVTTPPAVPILQEAVTISRDSYRTWELTFSAGNRYAVEVDTDNAPVDLLVLDLANYQKFSVAFSSKSGTPWDQYVVLTPSIVQKRVEFKAPSSGKYRVVIENADFIPGGAVTTRDVNVVVRVYNLD
jgi:hypothetical protein